MSQEDIGQGLVSESATCDSSTASSKLSSRAEDIVKDGKCPTAKEVVQTLTSFVRIEKTGWHVSGICSSEVAKQTILQE